MSCYRIDLNIILKHDIERAANFLFQSDTLALRIDGSKGGTAGTPPQRDPILSFLDLFSPKSTHLEVSAPQREILDPPLLR